MLFLAQETILIADNIYLKHCGGKKKKYSVNRFDKRIIIDINRENFAKHMFEV